MSSYFNCAAYDDVDTTIRLDDNVVQHKEKALRDAINSNTLPPVCSCRERWGDRKCLGYCAGRENCPFAQ